MASVRVAVRVRPMNRREEELKSKFIISMDGKKTCIENKKIPQHSAGDAGREKYKDFTFDYSYWTVNRADPKYCSQEQVYKDLGVDVVNNAYEGYNVCVFAYGQTGSGKTYTMMGNPGDEGLIPRVCKELFNRMKDESMTYRAEVSYLEIYNEKVRDLLKLELSKAQHGLRVREHPRNGPYVQDLSKHLVVSFENIKELMDRGSANRATASTNMNDVSSRSHAIFTIVFTQAKFSKESPIEKHSKIHLVDLAGSERADATGATGLRLKEGGSINKSLVTLGNVISTLAEISGKTNSRRTVFIPYRDSVLTWLLKDSLGGNAKTNMIATISPADCNYAETLSTLRYANRAKNIINKPTVNEDENVKLIRELRQEIARLRALLGGNIDSITTPKVKERLHESEARVKVLTQEWTDKWTEVANILEDENSIALKKQGMGVVLDSQLPHLIGIDDDLLSTGIMLYHLNEGSTSVGNDRAEVKPDIILAGPDIDVEHCKFQNIDGDVVLIPAADSACSVNGKTVTETTKLSQGAVILLGQTNMFRFNHPAQAAKLRQDYKASSLSLSRISLSQSMTDLCRSTESLALATSGWDIESKNIELQEQLEAKRQEVEEHEERYRQAELARAVDQEEKERELEVIQCRMEKLQMQLRQATGQDGRFDEEKGKLKSLIEEELKKLVSAESEKVKEIQNKKDTASQELSNLQLTYERDKHKLEAELKLLIDKKICLEAQQKEGRLVVQEKQEEVDLGVQNLQTLEKEQDALQKILDDPQNFKSLSHLLSTAVKKTLLEDTSQLLKAKEALHDKEQGSYQEYSEKLARIEQQREITLRDVAEEREQVMADKVCLQECVDRLPETLATGDMDAYNREKQAIEAERQRIEEEESKLGVIEGSVDTLCEEDKHKLQLERSDQVTLLNAERSEVRQRQCEWQGLVKSQKTEVEWKGREMKEKVDQLGSENEAVKSKQGKRLRELEQQGEGLKGHIEEATSAQRKAEEHWLNETAKLKETGLIQLQLDQVMLQDIQNRRDILGDIDVESIGTDTELHKVWLEVKTACSETVPESVPELRDKVKELEELEQKIAKAQSELDEKLAQLERERQEEGDSLEKDRFKLLEIEEQERVNTLVEQEIKRRLFEERVEREKQRRIEREREKAERDRELSKIKRAHQKELERLREKIENKGGIIENAPTKANPYASVMSEEATPTSSTELKKTKSLSRTNLARAQSTSSISVTGKPIKIQVPGFVQRGAGLDSHIEFEVKINVLDEDWTVFRRYSKFREFHHDIKHKFPEVGALLFPPKRWFGNKSEKVAAERQIMLEIYLSHVIDLLQTNPRYPLHPSHSRFYTRQVLCDFHPFFKKGLFEASRHGTA